jgi:hypothetical protein
VSVFSLLFDVVHDSQGEEAMKLTISTPSFGPLKVALARPFDLAIELTKIRYSGRTVEIGFHFKRRSEKLDDWRLHDFVCEPVRGEISDELVDEICRVGKREIGAWIVANTGCASVGLKLP